MPVEPGGAAGSILPVPAVSSRDHLVAVGGGGVCTLIVHSLLCWPVPNPLGRGSGSRGEGVGVKGGGTVPVYRSKLIKIPMKLCPLLKGQSNEIFDLQFLSSFEPAWATDPWVKICIFHFG